MSSEQICLDEEIDLVLRTGLDEDDIISASDTPENPAHKVSEIHQSNNIENV